MATHRYVLAGHAFLLLSLACFAAYVADIVFAKLADSSSFIWPYELGAVGQFLLVLAGCALLVVSALFKEVSSQGSRD